MIDIITIGRQAKTAARSAALLTQKEKNKVLLLSAQALVDGTAHIIEENKKDMEAASGLSSVMLDRLALDDGRIAAMAEGLAAIAALNDPTGEYDGMKTLPNGLTVCKKRVPMGVVAIIYEARPNVTADAFGLCLKSGNSVILRGGKEAVQSNKAIVSILQKVLAANGFDENIVQLVADTSRESAMSLMKMNKYIDVLIPRGGAGLIQTVVENATVPIIETGTGNCHIYVDGAADLDKASKIIINAKTQRPSVCNACEKVLLHSSVAANYLPVLCKELWEKGIEIRGDARSTCLVPGIIPAVADDWHKEYLDNIIAIRIVDSIDEAIDHISKYSSGHSEAIITENYSDGQKFLNQVDAAAVYINASTRFTDGFEFGFGAEIGISTQKLHARGPMGLKELTTTKYIVYGNGQIRN